MFVKRLAVGALGVNCYIVADEEINQAVVIDPGAEPDKILKVINNQNLTVKYVINTHGHSDHITANEKILKETGAQLLIHQDDVNFLQDPKLNLSFFTGQTGQELKCPAADKVLKEGDEITCGNLKFEVIHTPGHTPGGICLKLDNILFTGDTLFSTGVGRTDLPKGSYQELKKSVNRIIDFEENLKICPGHGPTTTLDRARKENPYIYQGF